MAYRDQEKITIKVMPSGDGAGGSIQTYYVPRWRIAFGKRAPAITGVLVAFSAALLLHTLYSASSAEEVRAENARLKGQIEGMDGRVEELGHVVDRVTEFDARIRKATMLSDPDRSLAMGPVGASGDDESPRPSAAPGSSLRRGLLMDGGAERGLELVENRLDLVGKRAESAETSVRALEEYLEDQQSILASTPSLSPTRGWRTSTFGTRVDPYTGVAQMHTGLDIASDPGRKVVATADGVVTLAGAQSAYGNVVVVDHGHGLVTSYAHLASIDVKLGDEVRRGAQVGAVGNTGRSTGPHLHYEIRLNGIPQDPDRFILE